MTKKVLITGGTGLVGQRLTRLLTAKGYEVRHLSRSKSKGATRTFQWDIDKGYIEDGALDGIDFIVHLAGAGVADSRWTAERKKIILESRTKSTRLLFDNLKAKNSSVKAFISASAIGLYGFDTGDSLVDEASPAAQDFLADVVKQWELEIDGIADLGIRTCKMRIGIVLSNDGGALAEMSRPVKYAVGAALGSGKQYMSWVHIEDVCNMFIHAIENDEMQGAFNVVAPNPVQNLNFMKIVAQVMQKPFFLPAVPAFFMKLVLGEMAVIVLGGIKASSKKIENTGFAFIFPKLEAALNNLLKNN